MIFLTATAYDLFPSLRYVYLYVTLKNKQNENIMQSYPYYIPTMELITGNCVLPAKDCCAFFILQDSYIADAKYKKNIEHFKTKRNDVASFCVRPLCS